MKELVRQFKSWGKHFLIFCKKFTVKIHFMLFGSYSINEKVERKLTRLGLHFKKGDLYFYACSIQFIEEDLDTVYDWSADVMSEAWSPVKAKRKLKLQPGTLVCDALLGQQVFAGVGNIIKNEVCFRIHTPRKRSRRATNPAVEPNGKGSKKLQL